MIHVHFEREGDEYIARVVANDGQGRRVYISAPTLTFVEAQEVARDEVRRIRSYPDLYPCEPSQLDLPFRRRRRAR